MAIELNEKPSILITFDSMKYPNTGLFHFGRSLGKQLIVQNDQSLRLSYYMYKRHEGLFGDKVNYVNLSKLHQFTFWGNNNFDLVHFTDQYCRLKPHRVKGKKIITIHDLNQVHELENEHKKVNAYIKKLSSYVASCDRVVAISNFVAGDILTYFPEASSKISVIYNGADKLDVPEKHIPVFVPNKPFLFTIGILSAKKNFHVLPCLLEHNDYQLIISGISSEDYKQQVLAFADKFGVRDRVIITGPISDTDKAWYYKHCTAFLFPSLAEGFGLPVIEAMHHGKPVFLSNKTSLPEIGGSAAFYFESFEAGYMQECFKTGLDLFYRDPLKKDQVISRANQFSWAETARSYLKLYSECLS